MATDETPDEGAVGPDDVDDVLDDAPPIDDEIDVAADVAADLDAEAAALIEEAERERQALLADVDIEALLAERDQFLTAYQRAQADFENFRKLSQKRQQDEVQRSLGAFAEALLPVLDACDAAIAHGDAGAQAVFDVLMVALEKQGMTRVDPLGEPFDPNVAEAVVMEPGDGGDQVVSEVLRVGYLWNERVLRPAMVKVKD